MLRSTVSKTCLLVVLMMLSISVPIVSAQSMLLDWTSPTKAGLSSVFMLNANDGWAVGEGGGIIHWNGTDWNNVTSPAIY